MTGAHRRLGAARLAGLVRRLQRRAARRDWIAAFAGMTRLCGNDIQMNVSTATTPIPPNTTTARLRVIAAMRSTATNPCR